jgi:UDP-N-acetylmuramoyl-tripeptide--D-alanyl-D-alanine ligase
LVEKLKLGVEGPRKFDHCSTANEARDLLQNYLGQDDIVLVKGSNSIGLSAIVASLVGEEN